MGIYYIPGVARGNQIVTSRLVVDGSALITGALVTSASGYITGKFECATTLTVDASTLMLKGWDVTGSASGTATALLVCGQAQ